MEQIKKLEKREKPAEGDVGRLNKMVALTDSKVNDLIRQFSNSVSKGTPMNMSLLTDTLLKMIGQILNPASIQGDPLPIPGLGKALKYIKHQYQPVRSLDLIEGKTTLLMSPHTLFNFWKQAAFTYGKSECKQIKIVGVKTSEDVDARNTVVYGVTATAAGQGRFTIPQSQVRESWKIIFSVGKSGGYCITPEFNGSIVTKRSAGIDLTTDVQRNGRYWFGYDATAAPVAEFNDATIDLGANDVVGIELIPDDDSTEMVASLNFDNNQVNDADWFWGIQSNTGLGWLGFVNPSVNNNPLFEAQQTTAMSGWLANDAPALYKGGELLMARVHGYGVPPLGNSDYPTWISSINNHSMSFPLAKGGYQYHVPSYHVEQNLVRDDSPFSFVDDKYFYAIDYSVTVDGNVPLRIPCHFMLCYVQGYSGVDSFLNVNSLPDELGLPRALTNMYQTYIPLENLTHLSQLVDKGLSIANDLYGYGKKIITSPVTQKILKDVVEKGLPLLGDGLASLF